MRGWCRHFARTMFDIYFHADHLAMECVITCASRTSSSLTHALHSPRLPSILRLLFLPTHSSCSFLPAFQCIFRHPPAFIPADRGLDHGGIYADNRVDFRELFGLGTFAVRTWGDSWSFYAFLTNLSSVGYVDPHPLKTPYSFSFILDSSSLTRYIFNITRFCSGSWFGVWLEPKR